MPQAEKVGPVAKQEPPQEYERIKGRDFGIDEVALSLTYFAQSPDDSGDVRGKVDYVLLRGKSLDLETKNIVHEGRKAFVVTKAYGKIRISGGYAQDCPPNGLCLWLTPAQQAQLRGASSKP